MKLCPYCGINTDDKTIKKIIEALQKSLELYFDCTGHGPDHCMHCKIVEIVENNQGE